MQPLIDPAVLATFLVEAHRNTYADKSAAKAPSSRPKSFDYRFERFGLIYHDTYFGLLDFVGEEIIYREQAPVWGMNYYGVVLAEDVPHGEVYDFLREALMQDCPGIEPARGPQFYNRDSWSYDNAVHGKLDDFSGMEAIRRDGRLVYRCRFHGGWIR